MGGGGFVLYVMGFNVTDVLSDESHYSEFLCVFCRDLADDAHVLPCVVIAKLQQFRLFAGARTSFADFACSNGSFAPPSAARAPRPRLVPPAVRNKS